MASDSTRRLLLMSCSQRKQPAPGVVPAVERYDGPAFRVLRRYLGGQPIDPPDIYILSAEFGLISGDSPIPTYDRRMTRSRAEDLEPSVAAALHQIFDSSDQPRLDPNRVLVCLGKDYLRALAGYDGSAATILARRVASGGLGAKLTRLREWLHGEPSSLPDRPAVVADDQ